jgi:hypothetical protein
VRASGMSMHDQRCPPERRRAGLWPAWHGEVDEGTPRCPGGGVSSWLKRTRRPRSGGARASGPHFGPAGHAGQRIRIFLIQAFYPIPISNCDEKRDSHERDARGIKRTSPGNGNKPGMGSGNSKPGQAQKPR